MDVRETIDLGNGHLIEIGSATWDSAQTSIRSHYPTANGSSNSPHSSEIPLADVAPIVTAIAQHDLLGIATAAKLIELLAASLARRVEAASPPSLQKLLERVTEENCHAAVETGPAY